MLSRGNKFRIVFLAAVAGAPLASHAATITQCGPNICYEYDDAQAAIALTGLPTLVGDAMTFLPPSFLAHSTDGAGFDTATANFIFDRVYTTDVLNEIVSFDVHEEFDYEIITDGNVRATLYTQARSLVNALDGTSTTVNFGPVSGDTGGNQIDTLDALLNPAAAFTDIANNMSVTIQNTLRAYTGALGEDAFIQKKFTLVTETMNPAPVPVPAAVWLFGSALGVLVWLRRRSFG